MILAVQMALLLLLAALCWPPRAAVRALPTSATVQESSPLPGWARLTRRARPAEDVAARVEAMATALRAGLPVAVAWAETAGTGVGSHPPSLLAVEAAARAGRSPAAALRRHARLSGHAEWAMAARAWAVSERTGAPLATALNRAAASGRTRREQDRRVEAAAAGARATMTVLTCLPLAGVPVSLAMGLSPGQVYGHPAGAIAAALGVPLIVLGRRLSRRLVRGVEEAGR